MTKRVKISLIVLFALKVTISSAQVEYCPLVTQVYHINLSGNNPPGYVGDYFETPCGNFNVGGYHYKDGNYPAPATFSLYDIFSSFWVIGSAPFLEMFTPSGEFAQTIVPPIVYLEGNVVSSNIYPPPIYGSIELLWYNGYSTWSFNNYEGVAYLGFFRIMPDGLHYGWIRFISSNLNGFSFQLLGLAWETRPNVPIVCGDEGYDCPAFDTPPVGLTKSFNPVAGVQDRVQLKWFKEENF